MNTLPGNSLAILNIFMLYIIIMYHVLEIFMLWIC